MYRISWFVALYVGLLVPPTGIAQPTGGAEAVVRAATERMYQVLQRECRSRQPNAERMLVLVDEVLMPHADFQTMSRWVLGKYWRRASPDQRQQIMQEFKRLLVRTYASAIESVSLMDITYLPERSSGKAHKAVVRTQVKPPGAPVFPVHYHMHRKDGSWLVYDLRIEGVSLVASYRSSFGAEIEARGVQGLIASLKEKNGHQIAGRKYDGQAAQAASC